LRNFLGPVARHVQHLVGVLAEQGWRAIRPARLETEAHRQADVAKLAEHGMLRLDNQPARLQLRMGESLVQRVYRRAGNAGTAQCVQPVGDGLGRNACLHQRHGLVEVRNARRMVEKRGESATSSRPATGQNQGIQHPLARSWMELEAAHLMAQKAAWLYDQGQPCAAEANSAKFLGAEAAYTACENAIFTHGGMGYAKEYHVERYMREAWIPRLAPVSPQLILCFIAEKVLGLPKSY